MQSTVEAKLITIEAIVMNIEQEIKAISELALQRIQRKTQEVLPGTHWETTPTPNSLEKTRQLFKRKCVFEVPPLKKLKPNSVSSTVGASDSEILEESEASWVKRAKELSEVQINPEQVFGPCVDQLVDLPLIFPESKRNYTRQSADCWTID